MPTEVDTVNNTLTTRSDHLTLFDFDTQNWEAATLPTLDGFQVGQFTGAAQYSYAFALPPGPGGWAPQLSLSYNSQSVDSASKRTQAAWVGMGWSLDTGYIERETRGSKHLGDDSFLLVLNGASYPLLPDGTGRWRTADESFLRIQFNGSVDSEGDQDQGWKVWDKAGNRYAFGDTVDHRATFPRDDNLDGHNDPLWVWRWS